MANHLIPSGAASVIMRSDSWRAFAIACGIWAALTVSFCSPVEAAWITKQGVTWNTDWLPTEASLVYSPTDPTAAGSPLFVFGSAWSPTGWIVNQDHTAPYRTVGDLLYNQVRYVKSKELSINLGPGVGTGSYYSLFSEIELSWGSVQGTPVGYQNLPGNDLAIYENGYPPLRDNQNNWRGGSDVFLVSLGYVENGSLEWTGYRYTQPTNYEPLAAWVNTDNDPNDGNFGEGTYWASGPTYLTLIDAGDFDLPLGTWIIAVRIRNAVYGYDEPESSGSGWVTLNASNGIFNPTDPPLSPFRDENGDITTYLHPKYNNDSWRYDPDITVVVPLHGVMPIPEPGLTIALCSGLGAFLPVHFFGRRRRRVD